MKNCDRGLENAARGRGHGQHFQARGHSFSLCGPTISFGIHISLYVTTPRFISNYLMLVAFSLSVKFSKIVYVVKFPGK